MRACLTEVMTPQAYAHMLPLAADLASTLRAVIAGRGLDWHVAHIGALAAFALSEPEAGSAAGEMTTTAVKRGDTWVINGVKHWITGGGVSRLHLIFAKVYDEKGTFEGIGGFLAAVLDKLFPLGDTPDYEPTPDRAVTALAEAAGAVGGAAADLAARGKRSGP